jgi:hypothetical protein
MLKNKPGLIKFNDMRQLNLTLNYSLLIMVLALTACKHHEKVPDENDKPKQSSRSIRRVSEEEAVSVIANLEEVKRKNELVVRDSKGKRHLSTYAETPPTAKDLNYYVKVAEDNGGSYVTYYIFAVNSKTSAISFYDVLNDKLLPLNTWRRTIPLNER